MAGLSNVVAVAAANDHTCALVSGGTVACWGSNYLGALGTGSLDTAGGPGTAFPPTAVAGLSNVTSIAATDETTCVIRSDGTVWCWGVCGEGQCGNPSAPADDPNVTQVCASTSGATGVDAGACASFLTGATSVSGGANSFCAILSGGTVACWGANVGSFTPVTVAGLSGVSAVAVGEGYACALQSTGTVACWGSNADGQLGNGTTLASTSPTAVTGLTGAIAIAATQRDTSTCALLSGGTVQCWGDNDEGQLGNGTTTNALTPTPVSNLSQVTAISGAACALLTTGQIECWGPGSDGQLGNGTTVSYSDVPVFVE